MAVTDESPIVLPDDPGFGPDVQLDYPGYRSTRWRAPDRPLATLPEELHWLEGPVFGEEAVGPGDNDLTRQHEGDPLGERIVVTGRPPARGISIVQSEQDDVIIRIPWHRVFSG